MGIDIGELSAGRQRNADWNATSGPTAILNKPSPIYTSFVTGTGGTNFAISTAGSTVTFNLPDAALAKRGLVTTGAQTFGGAKTIQGNADAVQLVVQANSTQTAGIQEWRNSSGVMQIRIDSAFGLNMNYHQIYYVAYLSNGVIGVNLNAGQLVGSGGDPTVNWDLGTLTDTSALGLSLNWTNRIAYDAGQFQSLDYGSRVLRDSNEGISLAWEARYGTDSGGGISFNYDNRTLNGYAGQVVLNWTSTNVQLQVPLLLGSAAASTEGSLWYSNSSKMLQTWSSGLNNYISGTIFSQTADKTVTNTVTETSIFGTGVGTLTLPANFFVSGKTLKFRISGVYSTPIGAPSATIKIKLGSTVIASVTTTALLSNASGLMFQGEGTITCRTTGVSGTVMTNGTVQYATGVTGTIAVDALNNGAAAATVDTTASKVLDVTVTWDAATTTRSVKSTTATVEVFT